MKSPETQGRTGINALVLDEHIPTLDDRDENGRSDGKYTNKEKEDVAYYQYKSPAQVQRFVPEQICSICIKSAWANKRKSDRSKELDVIALKYNMGHSKEVGVSLPTWCFERVAYPYIGIKAQQA